MWIIPAIDIRGGKCVRLRQGRFDEETVFGDDPVAMGRRWAAEHPHLLHVVDLDGARSGKPVNLDVVEAICGAIDVPVELGGGIRTDDDVSGAFDAGVARVIIGSRAARNPDWFLSLVERYPDRIAAGVDARDNMVAVSGWVTDSGIDLFDLAGRLDRPGLASFIFTNIARDGMLLGPDVGRSAALAEAVQAPVIASGGVGGLDHIKDLARTPVAGVVVGRALYDGCFTLRQAIDAAEDVENLDLP